MAGFRPVGNMDGTAWNGATITCVILAADSNRYAIGDLVNWTTSTATASPLGATGEGYYPVISRAAAGAVILGSIVAFDVLRSDLTSMTRLASTALRTCQVAVATPTLLFETTADDVANLTAVLNAFDHNNTASTGDVSLMTMDIGATSTSATFGFQWVGVTNTPDNLATISSSGATTTATKLLVRCLEPQASIGLVSVPI